MAMFLGHIAFMFELAVFVGGLALWYFGSQRAAGALRAGALIAMIGAALSALCTGYYLVRYSVQGDLDNASSFHSGMMRNDMMKRGERMGPGMMGPGMMGGGMMGGKMGGAPGQPGEMPRAGDAPEPPGHEQHHPGQVD